MLKVFAPLAAAMSLCLAGTAAAAATVTVQGRLVAEQGLPFVDPNLEVGDTVIAEISFDPYSAIQLGGGYSLAQTTALHVSSNGFHMPFSDILDGSPIASQYFETNCEAELGPGCLHHDKTLFASGSAIIYKGSKVVGLIGTSAPNQAYGPDYDLGSGTGPYSSMYIGFDGYCLRQSAATPYVCSSRGGWGASSQFTINPPTYLSTYQTQGFFGQWDFNAASIAGVPEPATWAMMILGFGLSGAALRRSRQSHVGLSR